MIFCKGQGAIGPPKGSSSGIKSVLFGIKGFSSEFKGRLGFNFFVRNVGGFGGFGVKGQRYIHIVLKELL